MVTRTAFMEPAVARRLLRYELGCLCARAGVTHKRMGARLGISRAAFSQIIAGRALPSPAVLEVVARELGADHRLPVLLDLLASARSRRQVQDVTGDRELLVGLEAFADTIEIYDPLVISPLLRTGSYARALSGGEPRSHALTTNDPPALIWVVEEHALRRVVGNADAMRNQYDHLCGLIELANFVVQVLPADRHAHVGVGGGFEIVHGSTGSVACEMTRRAALYFDKPEIVAEYAQVFSNLRSLAMSPEKSEVVIRSL